MVKKTDDIDIQGQLLLRELEEEHRRAQLEKLVKAYAPYAAAVAVAIVVGVGGLGAYRHYAVSRAEALGERYEKAQQLAEGAAISDEARKAFDSIAGEGTPGYRTLARLRLAAAEAKAGRVKEAVGLFDGIAEDRATDPLLRSFAELQAAMLRASSADWTEMQNRLNDLVGDKSPWRHNARELYGVAALKAGKVDEARRSFEQLLADRGTPPSIGQRAQIMMAEIVAAELAKAPPAGAKKE